MVPTSNQDRVYAEGLPRFLFDVFEMAMSQQE
jgi:hypothetical protein